MGAHFDIRHILEKNRANSQFHQIIDQAIAFLDGSKRIKLTISDHAQSSSEVADLHAFRKQNSYYNEKFIYGLDQTIASLKSQQVPVWLAIAESEKGIASIWLDKKRSIIRGLLIIKYKSE